MKTSNVQPASRKATAGKQAFVRQRPDCGAAIAQLTLALLSTSQLSRDLGNITVQANDVAAARKYFEEALTLGSERRIRAGSVTKTEEEVAQLRSNVLSGN